ncbi:MAG: cytochrome D1 domain-containing protein, partial [Candidatus Eisenbacteria bacterium]|nr:cytochrome D1 domain-containing protein [Candidatus Eisenbacteria bacterium]
MSSSIASRSPGIVHTFGGVFTLGAFFVSALAVALALALALAVPAISAAETASVDPGGEAQIQRIHARGGETIDSFLDAATLRYTGESVDPGIAPEGDYMGWPVYTRDGARVILPNRMTDNVTFFDAATRQVLANVPVGRYPCGVDVSNDYAVVACVSSNEVYVIDLDDYSVDAVIPTGEQPWVVRVAADGSKAYVSCDIANTCEQIDLATLTHGITIPNFPVALLVFTFGSENGRNSVDFTNFELTPDGGQIAVGDFDTGAVLFYDTATGALAHTVPGISDCVQVEFSGDGGKLCAFSDTNPIAVHQIDVATHTLASSVTLTGYQFGATFNIGVNQDGSKAYVSVSGNQSAFVRFATHDFTTISQTYSAFWIGTSPDHTKVISGQYRFTILSFATESILGQHEGNAQAFGAVSPVGSRAVGHDPIRNEGLYFYDYTTPGPGMYLGNTPSGQTPEGDCPRRVAITPDGSKAVVTNVLSGNATILNLATKAVEAIVPVGGRAQDVAITSDGRWAVAAGLEADVAAVIDLQTNTVVANVPTGTRPGTVVISPDNQYAYVGNISGNTITVIRLAGAASVPEANISCGEIGVVWANYGVLSGSAISPDGRWLLVAASFDDRVKVIDTVSRTVVANLTVGDFPLEIAFNGDGQYAIVTNYFGNGYTVMRIDGASSSVVGTFVNGQGALRLDYNPVANQTGIGNYTTKNVVNVNPVTGAFVNAVSFAAYGALDKVLFDENGVPVVLTASATGIPAQLHRGSDHVELPAEPSFFDYNAAAQRAVVTMPGPDWVTIVDWAPAGVETVTLPLDAAGSLAVPQPNPVRAGAGARTS